MVPPCFARTSRPGPWSVQEDPIRLRYDGRPRRSLMYAGTLGARLRDHVQRGLPYPFPPAGALCDVSPHVLFSSLPLSAIFHCLRVALSLPRRSGSVNGAFDQKGGSDKARTLSDPPIPLHRAGDVPVIFDLFPGLLESALFPLGRDALVQTDRHAGAHGLEDLHQHHQDDDRHIENDIHAPLVAQVEGHGR